MPRWADLGRLDIAHNNAGVTRVFADTADYPPAVWHLVLAVYLTGVFHCLQAELAQLLRQSTGGAIVRALGRQRALAVLLDGPP